MHKNKSLGYMKYPNQQAKPPDFKCPTVSINYVRAIASSMDACLLIGEDGLAWLVEYIKIQWFFIDLQKVALCSPKDVHTNNSIHFVQTTMNDIKAERKKGCFILKKKLH